MTASLPPIQPAPQSAAPQSTAAQDTAAPEVPFSQVLSGEMAQQRRAEAAGADAAPAETADTAAAPAVDATNPKAVAGESGIPGRKDAAAPDDADAARTDSASALPDAMLALALHPELLKPAGAAPPAAPAVEETGARVPPSIEGAKGTGEPAARAASATPTAPGTLPAVRASRAEANAVRAGTDEVQPRADRPAAAPEKTPLAEAIAQRIPDAARNIERAPDFAAAMAAAQTAQIAGAAVADLQASDRLNPAVGTSAWNQALGDRIVWMASGGQQSASLTLNPPDLGPMQVVVNVTNDQATASFFAHQPEVRQALEAALPRLREMMQDAGIQLGQATVSADTPRQQDMQDRAPQRAATPFMGLAGDDATAPVAVTRPVRTGRGLVDTFA